MKDRSVLIIVAVLVLGTVALATGFKQVALKQNPWIQSGDIKMSLAGEASPVRRTVEASGAQTANVTLQQTVGAMHVKGGASSLMDATFDTSPSSWLPTVDYSVEGTTGTLSVDQPSPDTPTLGRTRNTWRVSLTETMPLDLTIERGVGEGDIDLSAVDVTALRAVLGVGATAIDLSGTRPHDVEVSVEGGIGQVTLTVPSDMAVRITAENGIGEISAPSFTREADTLTNPLYGKGGPTMNVHVKQGIGEVRVVSVP